MAQTLNLSVDQGTHFKRVLTFTDGATPTPNPIDLTGYSFKGQVRTKFGVATASFDFQFTIRTQSGADLGKVEMFLEPADTASIALKDVTKFVYDVEMTNASLEVKRVFQGTLTLLPEVTKT